MTAMDNYIFNLIITQFLEVLLESRLFNPVICYLKLNYFKKSESIFHFIRYITHFILLAHFWYTG